MDNIAMLPSLIQKNDWMVKTDIKDAYLSVPIAEEHQPYLGFQWNQKSFMFRTCPFGMSSAPRLYTKLLKPAMAMMRKLGMRVIIYLDDCLIMNQDRERLLKDRDTALFIFQMLGLVINWKKSQLIPCQQIEFLGFRVDSQFLTLTLPQDKVQDIKQKCLKMVQADMTTVRKLAKLIGKLTATAQAVLVAPLHYRRLQMQKSKGLLQGNQAYEAKVELTSHCKEELRWWISELENCNGKTIMKPQPDLVITSDASKIGWGGECQGQKAQGQWSMAESQLHINVLEMKAAELSVKSFTKDKSQIHCHLRLDNSSCVAQINKMGGTRSSQLFEAVSTLWKFCLQKEITLTAEHLAGEMNTIADNLSRVFLDSSNWKLQAGVFMAISQKWGPLEMDLFADRLNSQLEQYASWKPDPNAKQVDAFLMDWSQVKGYAFPPFCLINRCLAKIRLEEATIILVAPVWTAQVWYPQLLGMLAEEPMLLPPLSDLLLSPRGQPHPLLQQGNLQLAAWKVSGKRHLTLKFQNRLKPLSKMQGGEGLKKLMSAPGENGIAGVLLDKLIPFMHLWEL